VSASKHKSREKRQTWAENREKTETSIEENSLYKFLFVALSVSNQR
jgi:hypothetical protein